MRIRQRGRRRSRGHGHTVIVPIVMLMCLALTMTAAAEVQPEPVPVPGVDSPDATASPDEPASDTAAEDETTHSEEPTDGEGETAPIEEATSQNDDEIPEVSSHEDDEDGHREDSDECDCDNEERASYVLESIEIRGNRRTRESVINRALAFRPGQVLDLDDPAIELARYRLLATGFFVTVDLRLRRGSRRGAVVLVVEVAERWTFGVREIFLGVSEITPYGGLHAEEINLIGLGISLSGAFVAGRDQQGYRMRLDVPRFLDSPISLSFEFLYNDALDFLGRSPVLVTGSDAQEPYAIVDYRRIGGSIGTGVRLGHSLNIYLDYRLEVIEADFPTAAAQLDPTLGPGIGEPIDFHLLRDQSFLSALVLSLDYDTRDHPFLPTRGHRISVTTVVSTDVIGSNYHYFKLTFQADLYARFRWNHSLHFRLLIGTIFGSAPLYEQYFVGDLSDLNHSRVLDLNFSHTPPPNIFRNAVEEMRYESLAARFDIEYLVPLYQGTRGVYRLDFFILLGLYALGSAEDFRSPPAGYEGGPFPIDLTMNLGFRLDTTAGVFGFSFSNLLALIPFNED